MRRRLYVLFLVVSAIATYGTVLLWPVRPLWVVPVSNDWHILGFHEARNSFLTLDKRGPNEIYSSTVVVERDSESGQTVQTATIQLPESRRIDYRHWLHKDRMVIIHRDRNAKPDPTTGRADNSSAQFQIFDVRNGQCVGGPFGCRDAMPISPSPKSKWLWSWRSNNECVVFSVDGKETSPPMTLHPPYGPCFSSDQSQMATVIHLGQARKQSLVIYDLPSGREAARYFLPAPPFWGYVKAWEEGEIILGTLHGGSPLGVVQSHCFSFPFDGKTLGEPRIEEGLLDSSWHAQTVRGKITRMGSFHNWLHGDKIIRFKSGTADPPVDGLKAALEWLCQHTGINFWTPNDVMAVEIVERRTGKTMSHLSSRDCCYPAAVSPDFRRVVNFKAGTGLIMWELSSMPRWPVALGLALVPLGLGYVVRRRWRRGLTPVADAPGSPLPLQHSA